MLKEDAMTHTTDNTDAHSLYVLLISLLGTVISLPAVWYFAAHVPGLGA
jgi:hypothetical protein